MKARVEELGERRDVFERAPVPLWEQDLSEVRVLLDELEAGGITDLAGHLDTRPEALARFTRAIRTVRINLAAVQLFAARDREELIDKLEQTFPPEAWPVFREHLLAFAERRGHFEAETVLQTLEGQPLNAAIRSRLPGSPAEPDLALISIIDITARRRAEQERDRFFDLSLDPFCIVSSEGRLRRVNRAFERTLGYDADDLLTHPAEDFIHPDDQDATRASRERILAGEHLIDFENRYRCSDGSYRWLSWRAGPAPEDGLIYAVARDVTDRRAAEEALRESEERYRLLFSTGSAAIVVIEAKSGTIVEANDAALDLYGYSRVELIGLRASRLSSAPDMARAHMERLAASAGAQYIDPYSVHRRKDGLSFPVEMSAVQFTMRGQSMIYAVLRDLSEIKRTELALRESEEKYRELFGGVHDGLVIVDSESHLIEDANEAALSLYGYTRAEMIGMPAPRLSAQPEDASRRIENMKTVTGGPRRFAAEHRRKDGTLFPVEISAGTFRSRNRVLVYALFRDVTERERTQKALRESEATLRSLAESSPDYIMLLDREARIQFINRTVPDLSVDEVLGRQIYEFTPPQDHPRIRKCLEGVLASGQPGLFDTTYQARDGAVSSFESRVGPVVKDGEIVALAVTSSDVSWRKDLIAELEARNAELERFTYTVSHDLKSPLISIRGYVGLLEKDAEAGDRAQMREDVARVHAATEKMQELLDDLLELSRVGRVVKPPERVPFEDLARESIETVRATLQENDIEVEIADAAAPPLWGDPARLSEVVQNLVDNAIKHAGGERPRKIGLGARRDGDDWTYFVSDNGVGIEPRYHEKIFGLFDRLNSDSDGTGVGLALVKRIVEAHGGRVWVESEGSGEGSTFCFTIPDPGDVAAAHGSRPPGGD